MRKVSKAKAASAASAARQTRNASAESDNESVDSRVNGESDEEEFQKKTPSKKTKAAKRKGGQKASDQESESDSHANGDADAGDDEDEADADDDADDDDADDPPKKTSKSSKKGEATESDEEEYEVEDIIDSKRKNGEVRYLIRWKGYSAANDTWEPKSVVSCPQLLAAFHARKRGGKNKKSAASSKAALKRKSTDTDGRKKKKKGSDLDALKRDFDFENADEKAEYEVEKILEVHHLKNGQREFLIHWKGWAAVHDSWEPEKNLNCKDLITKFMSKVEQLKLDGPGAGGRISSGLRVAPVPTQRFTLNPQSELRRLSRRSANSQRVRYYDAE